jgi:hypothetical protein
MISLSWQMFGHGSSKIGVKTLENTEVAIKNGQSRETVNIGCTIRRKKHKTKKQHKMCWTPLYVTKHK